MCSAIDADGCRWEADQPFGGNPPRCSGHRFVGSDWRNVCSAVQQVTGLCHAGCVVTCALTERLLVERTAAPLSCPCEGSTPPTALATRATRNRSRGHGNDGSVITSVWAAEPPHGSFTSGTGGDTGHLRSSGVQSRCALGEEQ